MALTDKLKAIADAIRTKTGKSAQMSLDDMVKEIMSIEGGGGGGLTGFTQIYDGTLELTKNPSTSSARISTISIEEIKRYPLLLVVISNRDSTPEARKFDKSVVMLYNSGYRGGSVNISRLGYVWAYGSTGGGNSTSISATPVYGLWAYNITSTGLLDIYGRFSASYFTTLVGTYNVDVYAMDYVLQA